MDERGMELNGNRVGPVMEGSTLILTCDIIGGTTFYLDNRKYAVKYTLNYKMFHPSVLDF